MRKGFFVLGKVKGNVLTVRLILQDNRIRIFGDKVLSVKVRGFMHKKIKYTAGENRDTKNSKRFFIVP